MRRWQQPISGDRVDYGVAAGDPLGAAGGVDVDGTGVAVAVTPVDVAGIGVDVATATVGGGISTR